MVKNIFCQHMPGKLRRLTNNISFTLIELLVVIAIMSILMTILLPALKNAKELVKETACKNKLKQLGFCVQMYSTDYNGYFPCGYNDYGPLNRRDYDVKLMPYLENKSTAFGDAEITQPHFHCPSANGSIYAPNNPERWLGYSMNSYIVSYYETVKVAGHKPIAKIEWVEKPSKLLVMVDGGNANDTGDWNEWVTYNKGGHMLSPGYTRINYLAQRHRNGLNILFADSHVKWYARRGVFDANDPEGDDPIPTGVAFWNGYVFGE